MSDRPVFPAQTEEHETIEEYCNSFYKAVAGTHKLFRRDDGTLTFIDSVSGPRRLWNIEDFRSSVCGVINLRRFVGRGPRAREQAAFFDRDTASIVFGSEGRGYLPLIKQVIHEPAVTTSKGKVEIIDRPGFHPEFNVYYWQKTEDIAIRVREGTEHLEKCFSGVPWLGGPQSFYKNNVLAWLVSSVTLDDLMVPMLTVTGNDRGVGKSSVVQACGIILTGQVQNSIRPTGAEFEKQLGAKFMEEQRFVFMDNVVTSGGQSFHNPKLSALLTEGRSKQVRRLGQSRNITQSGVLFAVTMNECKLDADLATRSLPVQLFREMPKRMDPYCLHYALEHRNEIYGELLWLALNQLKCPPCPQEYLDNRFAAWVDFVYPIIFPRFGKLAIKQAEELDDRIQDLFAWGVDNIGRDFELVQLYHELLSNPERWAGLCTFVNTGRGERGKKTKLGIFLAQNAGRVILIPPEMRIRLNSLGGHPPRFQFQEIADQI